MSGSGRKRSSKWDLREKSHFETDSVQDHSWPGKESRPGWISPELASDDGSKWSGMEITNTVSKSKQDWGLLSNEPLPGTRASHKEDYNIRGYNKSMEGTAECDAGKSYGPRMSPGLDEWRRHSSNLSDRNDWSRSVRLDIPVLASRAYIINFLITKVFDLKFCCWSSNFCVEHNVSYSNLSSLILMLNVSVGVHVVHWN